MSFYNTTHLRILWEFSLDGMEYSNIKLATASAAGDFEVLNVKSDIVEQVFRTKTGTKGIYVQFDTGSVDPITANIQRTKATYIDTFAMLNTNLTLNADIYLYGYGNANTASPSATLMLKEGTLLFKKKKRELCGNDEYQKDVIWISENEQQQRFRHYAVYVEDIGNLDNFIEVGRILGGEATILVEDDKSGSHTFTDQIDYEEVSYTDKVDMNGFNEIANERAIKKKMSLLFDNVNTEGANYRSLRRYWRYCRDTKKALIIPTPKNPCAFHVFSKLEQIPKQRITYVEDGHIYVSFDLDYDEAR